MCHKERVKYWNHYLKNDSILNTAILLPGNLSSDVNCRRLVSDEAWKRFRFYFPKAPEFAAFSPICELCVVSETSLDWWQFGDHWL